MLWAGIRRDFLSNNILSRSIFDSQFYYIVFLFLNLDHVSYSWYIGIILQQWASLLKNSASIEKRKNLTSQCWRIVPVTVQESCRWLLTNHTSDCWLIIPATVEQSYQWLMNNRASDCWRIMSVTVKESCRWLLKNHASDCWRIMQVTVEE